MRDLYRKFGRGVRFEHARGGDSLVLVSEAGEAYFDENDTFRSRPRIADEIPGEIDPQPCIELAESTLDAVPRLIEVERLTLSSGKSHHEFGERKTRRAWTDSAARLHVSLVHNAAHVRTIVDIGGSSLASINLYTVPLIAAKLAALKPSAPVFNRIEISPLVTAQLVRPLLETALAANCRIANPVRFVQRSEQGWRDGNGQRVDEMLIATIDREGSAVVQPLNAYRPSYRSIPTLQPLHVDIEPAAVTSELECEATAIALASSPVVYDGRIAFDAIAADDEASYVITIDLPVADFLRTLSALDDHRTWFPAGAGTWGRRLALTRI